MSKFKGILLWLLITAMLVQSACINSVSKEQQESTQSTESVEVTTEESDLSETEEVTTEAVMSEESILDNREKLDDQGILWYIPNERIEQGLQQKLMIYQENLLVCGSFYENDSSVLKLTVISRETGAVLHENSISGIDISDVQVCGDLIAVTDWSDGDIILLDNELNITEEYQVEAESCAIYLNSDATKVYCFTQNNGIRITDIETGDVEVLLEHALGLFGNSRCGDSVTISYTDRDTQLEVREIVDLTKGTVMKVPFEGAFTTIEYSDEIWLAGILGEDNTYYLGRTERPNEFKAHGEYSMVSMLSAPTRIMSSYDVNGTSFMTLYGADGIFLSECKLAIEGGIMSGTPVWVHEDGGYYFIVTDPTGKDMLLFWNLATPIAGEDLKLKSVYDGEQEPGTVVSEALYDRALELSDVYGVDIKIAEQAAVEINEFAMNQEFDEGYISSGLDSIEAVLSAYPEGFMEQLLYGTQIEIEFNLVGSIINTTMTEDSLGFTSFVGAASEQEGKSVIAVDITTTGSLEQTLYHEIMHLIENKLEFDAKIREDAVYSEEDWLAFNPEGFVYAESYNDIPMDVYNGEYESWFVDLYSRTYSKEDRARIMEHAMAGNDWMYSASPGRLAKLEYLCECIRDAFDTTGWPEKTIWEETLERCK